MVPFCLLGKLNAQPGVLETAIVKGGTAVDFSGSHAVIGDVGLETLQDNALAGSAESGSLESCIKECESNPDCVGVQWGSRGPRGPQPAACMLRVKFKKAVEGTCLADCRAVLKERGFKDVPLVPLEKSDGDVYIREDCMDKTVTLHNNTYFGVPWDWEQPGVSFVSKDGYGVSPLLDLVTPEVLTDLVEAGIPPWRPKADTVVDLQCPGYEADSELWLSIIDTLKYGKGKNSRGSLRASVVDVSACICPMFGNGWDPRQDLKADAVFLLHWDQNYSPASPHTHINRIAEARTRVPCIRRHGNLSKFATDAEAFNALANSPHMLGMYFTQTPPISHEKVFLAPLGADMWEWIPNLRPHLQPESPSRSSSRAALYAVGHNLAIDYRKDVFHAVQENFAPEPLRVRYLPWASGSRMESITMECMSAVFGQSPIGIGENCFRHSELLLAGTIPVVQASLGIAAFRYFPHLAVSSWTEVTPELLKSSYATIWHKVASGDYSFAPLTNRFWCEHIANTSLHLPIDPFYAKFPNPPVTCPSWECV